MINGFRLATLLVLLGAGRTRAESAVMNRASSWHPLSTGALTVAQDEKEKAIRFSATFAGEGENRIWPLISARDGMFGVASLSFEMKLLPKDVKVFHGRIHFADQDGISGQFPFTPPSPGEFGKVEVAFDRPGFRMARAETLQIVLGTHASAITCLVKGLTLRDRAGKEIPFRAPEKVVPLTTGEDIRCFFTNPGESRTLTFKATALAEGKELAYEVTDYSGEATGQTGKTTVKNEALAVTETFPTGYYEVRFPELGLVFGVASLPPFAGEVDPYYAIEGLISSRPKHRQQLVELMLRGGIRSNREWCNYPALEPVRGTIKTNRDAFYTMAGAAGFQSIFCFADFPNWYYDGGKKIGKRPPPRRLLGLDESIATLLERRQDGLLAFHILNEYDIYDIPGEAYLPTIKVAGYAMADRKLPLVSAPFCRGAGASVQSSIDNGLLDFVDVFSCHSYSDPERMIDMIGSYRRVMAGHPKGGMPLWLTESGKAWGRGLSPEQVTKAYGGPLGKLHPQPKEDMTSAMWTTMRAIEAKAGGMAKHFAFTLPFFQERNKNFGMMDYHFTPLRSLTAYMHSIRELAGKQYLGDWRRRPAGVRILRVFGDKGQKALTAVVYTGVEDACTVELADMPWQSARAIDGRDLAATAEGGISVVGGLAYVTLAPEAETTAALSTATKAMGLLNQARAYQPVKRVSSPIVYQFDNWRYPKRNRKYYQDESNIFRVNVFNFSPETVSVAPQLALPEGMRIAEGPSPAKLLLKPRSEAQLTWKLDKSACPVARYDIKLTDPKHPHSGVSVPFLNYNGLRTETFDFMDVKRWRHNSSGASSFSFDQAEKAVRVSTAFDPEAGKPGKPRRDYWVFPEYVLDLPKESLVGAVAISLELKFRQRNGSALVTSPLVMFAYQDANEKGKYDSVTYGKPTEKWQKFPVPIGASRTDRYKMIRIGM
ncbi:MAG: hypothetical protein HN380_26495, partial [Victivallales bacterium]|nr:hypothetical protein [Victivallales bacterium]